MQFNVPLVVNRLLSDYFQTRKEMSDASDEHGLYLEVSLHKPSGTSVTGSSCFF